MAQIQKGETFSNGQQVDGTRLNNLVDASVLLVGAIAEQTSITANTLEATDSTIVNDAGVIKKATIGDILNSNLNTTFNVSTAETNVASAINGKTNKDINVTPNDGVAVTNKSFNSVDGITAVVTSTAHGLENNMLLDVTASNAVYTGQHFITVLTVDTFSFVIRQTTPVSASGTLSYTKKGSVKVVGNTSISGSSSVAGNLVVAGTASVAGVLTAPTATVGTNTTQVATTEYVRKDNQVKAWASYSAYGPTIYGSYGVSSITWQSTGITRLNFTTALVDNNYCVGISTYHTVSVTYRVHPQLWGGNTNAGVNVGTFESHTNSFFDSVLINASVLR